MPEVANLVVTVSADTTQAESGLRSLSSSVSSAGSALTGALGTAAVGAVAGLGAALVGSVKSAADFEKQISAISAVSGASASELEGLRSTALQLGKDTSFSASEAATGMEELVKAGVSIADVMGGAGRASLDLAAAGAVSVGDAAEIASNAMNVFSLKGSDMAHVADVIAGAANASAIGVNDYKFSLSAAGAVAATVGIGFEDLSTAIAVMGQAGIKGSDAGTSLKTMMLNLIPTTKSQIAAFQELGILTEDGGNKFFDASGKAKSMAEIAEVLKVAFGEFGATEKDTIALLEQMFGSDAIRAAAVFTEQGAAGFEAMAAGMGKVTARQVGLERLNNLWGSIEKLNGSLETGAIMLGSLFTPALKSMADVLTEQVNAGIAILEQIPDVLATIQQVLAGDWSPADTIQPFTLAVGNLAIAFRDTLLPTIQVVAGFVTETLLPAFQSLAGFLMGHPEIIAGIVAAWGAFVVITTVVGWIGAAIAAFGALSTAITAAGGVIATIIAVLGGPLTVAILAVVAVIGLLTAAWIGNWGDIQGKTAAAVAAITPLIQGMLAAIEAFWTAHGERIMTIVTAIWTIISTQFTTALTVLSGILTAGMQVLSGDWEGAWTTITTTAQAIWDGWVVQLGAVLTILTALFGPAFTAIGAAFTTGMATVQGIWDAGWARINAALTAAWNLLSTENQIRVRMLIMETTALWTTLGELWTTGTTALTTTMTTWWAEATTAWTTAQTTISETVAPWWETIKGYWDAALKAIGDVLGVAWAGIVTETTGLFTRMQAEFATAVTSLGKTATDLGTAIMDALIAAVNAKVKDMLDAVTGAVSGALSAARGLLGSQRGGTSDDPREYLRESALARGIDPEQVLKVMAKEGSDWSTVGTFPTGTSYGPLQLHYAGGSTPMAGMGDRFTAATGIDLRTDKSLASQQAAIDFALDELLKRGDWSEWAGAGPALGSSLTPVARVPAQVKSAQQQMVPQIGQFGLQGGTLTAAEAAAFCGPAAAMWFANIYGRMPNKAEAEAMARQVGWTPEWGMTGPGGEQQLLAAMGVASNVDYTPTASEIGALAGQNVPFMLSTAGHYYQVQGGDLAGLNVGASGTALAGGSATMSLDQIIALSGAMNGIITLAPQMGSAIAAASATGGAAFGGLLLAATTLSDGSTVAINQMGSSITATVTNASGQVIGQYGAMAEQVAASTTGIAEASTTMSTVVATDFGTMSTITQQVVTDMGGAIMTTTTDTAGNVITTVADLQGQVTSQFATLANGAIVSTTDMALGTTTTTQAMGETIATTVTDMAGNTLTTITDMSGAVVGQYVTLADEATAATTEMGAAVVGETQAMGEAVLASTTDMGDGVISIIADAAGDVTSTYGGMAQDVTGTTEEMAQTVVETMSEAGEGIGEAVAEWGEAVSSELGDIAGDAADRAQEIGEGITDGIAEGIEQGSGDVMDAVRDVVDEAIDEAKDEAESDSPSKLFARELGVPIAEGVAAGIRSASGSVYDATNDLVAVPPVPLAPPYGASGGTGGASGGTETYVIRVDLGGRVAEEIYVTGRQLALRRGRTPAGSLA